MEVESEKTSSSTLRRAGLPGEAGIHLAEAVVRGVGPQPLELQPEARALGAPLQQVVDVEGLGLRIALGHRHIGDKVRVVGCNSGRQRQIAKQLRRCIRFRQLRDNLIIAGT